MPPFSPPSAASVENTRRAEHIQRPTSRPCSRVCGSAREHLGLRKLGIGKGKAAHVLAAERHAVAEHGRRRRPAGRMIVSSARARTPARVRYV